MQASEMKMYGRYNWKGQSERLMYVGKNWSGNGYWHQFQLVSNPGEGVWCEVQDSDLELFEETIMINGLTQTQTEATASVMGLVAQTKIPVPAEGASVGYLCARTGAIRTELSACDGVSAVMIGQDLYRRQSDTERDCYSKQACAACPVDNKPPPAPAEGDAAAIRAAFVDEHGTEPENMRPGVWNAWQKAWALGAHQPKGTPTTGAYVWITEHFEMHPRTAQLVTRFARALAEKLAAAEKKYGYSDGWAEPGWMDECRTRLIEHLGKGDPRDVAAYCAFLWHHGESTAAPVYAVPSPAVQERIERLIVERDVAQAIFKRFAWKVTAFDWLMANCLKEDGGGWLQVVFETSRQREAHLPDCAKWVAGDIASAAGVWDDAQATLDPQEAASRPPVQETK